MITGELKNRIDSLWNIFAAGGIVNPLSVIEQITYLMFIHDLDEADNTKAKECAMLGLPFTSIFADEVDIAGRKVNGKQLKWSVFKHYPAGQMYSIVQENVFPFIKNLHADKNSAYAKYMDDAIFAIPTPLLLSKIVDALDEIYYKMNEVQSTDIRGDVYEYISSRLQINGRAGAFRTPRHIIRMMVELVEPNPNDIICDPACGTGGFLVTAGMYLKEKNKEDIFYNRQKKDHFMNHMFFGYDMDRTMLRIGAMNMMTHGIESPFIEYRDSLSDQNQDKGKYSLILANPPFKGSLDYDTVSTDLLKVCKTKKTELLFIALFLRMLRVGGRCACIVPDGVLFGSSKAHKDIRRALIEDNRLEAVISMPSGVFKPYAGVSTGILVFTKTGHGGTDKVWFYDMRADGFSLDDKRTKITDNDIPDIIARFRARENEADRKRTEQSFFVPKDEIVGNDYDLSINKYKQVEYTPVEYPPTSEILKELKELEKERIETLKKYSEYYSQKNSALVSVVELGEVCLLINGDRSKNYPSEKDRTPKGIPFINAGHLKNRQIDFEFMDYISLDKYLQMSKGKVRKNDILYCLRGSIGKIGLVNFDDGLIASSLVILRCNTQKVLPKYLIYVLESDRIKEQLRISNNGSSQPNLSAASVKRFQIPLPSIETQNEFVQGIEYCERLEQSLHNSLAILDSLKKTLMQEYFG